MADVKTRAIECRGPPLTPTLSPRAGRGGRRAPCLAYGSSEMSAYRRSPVGRGLRERKRSLEGLKGLGPPSPASRRPGALCQIWSATGDFNALTVIPWPRKDRGAKPRRVCTKARAATSRCGIACPVPVIEGDVGSRRSPLPELADGSHQLIISKRSYRRGRTPATLRHDHQGALNGLFCS